MTRRDFIKRGIGFAATTAFAAAQARNADGANTPRSTAPPTPRPALTGPYAQNRHPLQPQPFIKLPPGSIKPAGWLRHQLDLQLDGLNGRMTEVSDYLDYDTCGWVDPAKGGWEELPYWLRGFGNLGYVTGDERVLALTRKWINGILATQQPDGWFGPASIRTALDGGPDFWPHMPLLTALQSYHEYTGDAGVLPFMSNYFGLVAKQPSDTFNKGWGATRWADNLDTIFWLYNRTGDSGLLDLAARIHQSSADWTHGIPSWHNVNISQGFREPALYWLLSGDPSHLAATSLAYETVMRRFGQFPGGGFAGDENCRDGFHDPRQGFETCGFVELMRSFEILTRITGATVWADRCEEIAFNSLPAAFDPEQKGTHYITSANCIDINNVAKNHGQFSNDWPMQAYMPGVHNYRCCPHNYGMGWPNFAQSLWLATPSGGLCASMYAPSEVTALVGDRNGETVSARITQQTDYPFSDTIRFTFSLAKPVEFPLWLRIPAWCDSAHLRINGAPDPERAAAASYASVRRKWKNGDVVELRLPMSTAVRQWPDNTASASVSHGPLTFSLRIDEKWTNFGGSERWPEYDVAAGSPWNYALVLDSAHGTPPMQLTRKPGPIAANPFTQASVPIEMSAQARRMPEWQADSDNVVGLLPQSPAATSEPEETITLIPMASARLRITSFPVALSAHPFAAEATGRNLRCG